MKTLHLQETPTASIGRGGVFHTLTGEYTLIGWIEETNYILIECNDTHELFVINNDINLY
jgi:hypothetical protein